MTASSGNDSREILACLSADQIATLLDIVRSSKMRQTSFVESVYRERALHFQETLKFLQDIVWIKVVQDQLELTPEANRFRARPFRNYLGESSVIEAVTEKDNPYQRLLVSYLKEFYTNGNQVICTPSAQSRLEHGDIRNLLMQFGMVSHRADDDSYVLHEDAAHLYFWAKNSSGAASKEQLHKSASRKDALGTAAEEIVLNFEKNRVGFEFVSFVHHISSKIPGACFDIQSVSIDGDVHFPRFIEVKAVPISSCQFFWSSAELEAARVLRERYFLYLLPSLGNDRFDLDRMEMISNPYSTIYQNPESWSKEENVIVCRRINSFP